MVYTTMDITYTLHYYDYERGWDNTKRGWLETKVYLNNDYRMQVKEILLWMYDKVDNCERHARWTIIENYFHVKFRYERDLILFRLRWS